MNNNLNEFNPNTPLDYEIDDKVLAKEFMAQVFSYMAAALVISGIAAWAFGTSDTLLALITTITPDEEIKPNMLGWVVTFAPLGMVFLIGARYHKMSLGALTLVFLSFALVMGISLSYIFVTYTSGSIVSTFFITAGTFLVMAILGWRTRTDLTKFGSILYMALIGIIIAMVVNWFMESKRLDYIISFLGVLIFTGLTAYDVQKLKRIGAQIQMGTVVASKAAVMGAVSLYLDFINLFLFLLRFLGSRD